MVKGTFGGKEAFESIREESNHLRRIFRKRKE